MDFIEILYTKFQQYLLCIYFIWFSDIIITALLCHSVYVIIDGKVIKNGMSKWIPA